MVGGETQKRSFSLLKSNGLLVSVVSLPEGNPPDSRSVFFLADVTTARLSTLTRLFDSGELQAALGSVLPLEEARHAHEMLAGAPHARGNIVLACRTLNNRQRSNK